MSRVCGICTHPKREEIEAKIKSGKTSANQIAVMYKVSRKGVGNHAVHHMKAESSKHEIEEAELDLEELNDLSTKMKNIEEIVRDVLENAKLEKRDGVVLSAAKELRAQVELAIKAAAEIRAAEEMKQKGSWKDEWEQVKWILLDVFEKYPEAGNEFDKQLFSKRVTQFTINEPLHRVVGN